MDEKDRATNGDTGVSLWRGYFADPMVLKTGHGYFAYGTDGPEDYARSHSGKVFPLLHSTDLQEWNFVSGALDAPSELKGMSFWAPEVAYHDGRYFLYYSAGGDEGEGHKIRVAISSSPQGPFSGDDRPIIEEEPFSIDAHPFQDPVDGRWYLFFAKDFFDEPTGTGIAVARLADDLMSIEGAIVSVLRGQAAWQVFERDRIWYDQTWPAWYCVEGPFVVYRHGRYWMFYSGGNWHASDYGVGCAVSDSVLGPYVDHRIHEGAVVLHSHEGLRGPGHCSVTTDASGRDLICFHAWDKGYRARSLHIAPVTWTDAGPSVIS